jgi:hypothetical protein
VQPQLPLAPQRRNHDSVTSSQWRNDSLGGGQASPNKCAVLSRISSALNALGVGSP